MDFDAGKFTALARIGKPVGLAGMCRLFPFGDTIAESKLPLTLWVGTNRSIEQITLSTAKKAGADMLKAQFEGVVGCDAVEHYKNMFLYLETEKLPETDEDEFYFQELIGLDVETETGEVWGKIMKVHNFPTTDAVEVKRKTGKNVLLPFRKEIVTTVLIAENKIIVESELLEDLE